ncbi:MAG: DNA cytosine methyltransferase [Deltaproteobacteria bacterium]|nr:DNA cytosine methyltransferase [Deltaproteobacteria bacterium]
MPEVRRGVSGVRLNYVETLNEAWAQHLAPRASDALTVVSLFAGCGGSSLGYSMAGYREILAVEWDAHAVETFRANFPGVPVYHGDIMKLTDAEAIGLADIEPGQLDVLNGSPPCQGFSTAGKRDFTDMRNQLFREYVRLLRAFRPRAFVMENVPGMVKGKMKLIFAECMRELKESGYEVRCRLLNAKHFGVPQSRDRVIFIGIRHPASGIRHPDPLRDRYVVADALPGAPLHRADGSLILTPLYAGYWRAAGQGGSVGKLQSVKRLTIRKPSNSIVKSEGNGGVYHPTEPRKMMLRELSRLQSFPDAWAWPGVRKQIQERIGNSVPPLFMRAIALTVAETLHGSNYQAEEGGSIPTPALQVH